METSRTGLFDIIERESARLAEVAAGNLDARTVFYPAWTLLDLLVHTGSVHRRTTAIVTKGALERLPRVYPPDETPATVVPWFRSGYQEMIGSLRDADPAMPVWGFGPSPTVAFWDRRMAVESALHRWDAEIAVGSARPPEVHVAVAAVDDFAVTHLPQLPDEAPPPGPVVALVAIDAGTAWTVGVGDGRLLMTRGSGAGPVRFESGAADLYLWLTGRGAAPNHHGDPGLARWWSALLATAPAADR